MDVFSMIAEQKIQEAIQKGEMDNLPGQGKPLVLENWSSVPEDLRLAYKILKNSGHLPEEMQLHKEMVSLEELIVLCQDSSERHELQKRLNAKQLRLQMLMEQRGGTISTAWNRYRSKIENRLKGKKTDNLPPFRSERK
ncbi:hypothetical protein ERICIV_02110 [Paenibacillus larvae subsp. larvae]|uniref:DnaJ homologue subfamily C member 28 conserved domain-containing protein n=1 Tax=Paenibacillus larvae subsp. larvae TaxID=147375 RepID=A0A2L1U014_9BACL|nr:DnaJ family domain-containing protein [Paenibacillus larvae]AQT86596.1 hypothetical protein B1222_22975 [Paenibacillus larvae subsp. pulvifaciens]AQZ48278.1 hypothetical protein B5S25_18515 [Paenibacillus larvae subsp. pulvifaciens]AVF26254.1 hypothetical protein ERICIII_02089 [Paenibacillus larvae subsp. larvae]AVF31031.1 hypothetical protein ERICIV_02110 [Paenibacillus larvae subsp. larvae]MBH0343764.1 molecular chaperone DnaJ [Paenibacillus larvae]